MVSGGDVGVENDDRDVENRNNVVNSFADVPGSGDSWVFPGAGELAGLYYLVDTDEPFPEVCNL